MSIFKMMESLKEKEKLFEIKNESKNEESNELIQNEEKIKIQDLLLSQNSKLDHCNSPYFDEFSICQENDLQVNSKSYQNVQNVLYTFNPRDQTQEDQETEENFNYQSNRSLNESIKFLNENTKKIIQNNKEEQFVPPERNSTKSEPENNRINLKNLFNKISNIKFCLLKGFTECDEILTNISILLVKQPYNQNTYLDIIGVHENELNKIKVIILLKEENIFINLSEINLEGKSTNRESSNQTKPQTLRRKNDLNTDYRQDLCESIPLESFSILQNFGGKSNEKAVFYESKIQELKKSLREKEEEIKNIRGNMKYYESTIYASKNLIDELVSKNKLLRDKLVKYKVKSDFSK